MREGEAEPARTPSATAWLLFLFASSAWLIATTELLHDEAYYWTWSLRPDWSYFHHPPGVAWAIALSSWWLPGEWGVRLVPCLALFAGLGLAARALVPESRRWLLWAAIAASPLLSLLPAVAVPDTLLIALTPLFLWTYRRYLEADGAARALAVGAAAAALLYAKVHGGLVIAGAVLATPEVWRRPSLGLAAVLGALLLVPQALWQWQQSGVSFAFHLFDAHSGGFGWREPLEFVAVQAIMPGLLAAPWIWRQGWRGRARSPFDRVLFGVVAANLGCFFLFSFFKAIEANWTLAGQLALILLALRAAPASALESRALRALGLVSVTLLAALKLAFAWPAAAGWLPRADEVHGWRAWAEQLDRATPNCTLVANRYQVAGKLSFYLQRDVPSLNIAASDNQWSLWDVDPALRGRTLCWITHRRVGLAAEPWPTPTRWKLWLVRDVTIDALRPLDREKSGRTRSAVRLPTGS